uniref:Uncharacterized protein n=1 Tax=Ditylenchus dipsaci TaxID=166011 RepID=A0A915EHW6_9BILA
MHPTHTKPHHNVSAESLNGIIYRANFGVVSVCKFTENSSGSLQTEESENLKNLVLFLTPDNKSMQLEKDASCVLQFIVKSYEAVSLSNLYLAFHTTENHLSNQDSSLFCTSSNLRS